MKHSKKVKKITVFSTFSSSTCAHQALLSDQGLGIASGTTRSLGVDGGVYRFCPDILQVRLGFSLQSKLFNTPKRGGEISPPYRSFTDSAWASLERAAPVASLRNLIVGGGHMSHTYELNHYCCSSELPPNLFSKRFGYSLTR